MATRMDHNCWKPSSWPLEYLLQTWGQQSLILICKFVNLTFRQELIISYLSLQQQLDDGNHFFLDIDNFGKNTTSDTLEDFLNSPPISSMNEPIPWWYRMASNGNWLARMALDFLSAPGTYSVYFIFISIISNYHSQWLQWCQTWLLKGGTCCD